MQVIVNTLITHYESVGKGKKIIILHGWGDTANNWLGLQRELGKQYQVIALDLPGFGGTATPDGDWTLDDYAAFVQSFLTKINVKDMYAIIAHSNGGAIAMRGLSQGLLDAERLILLGSAGIRNEYKGRNKALRYAAKAGKAITAPLPKSAKKTLRQKVYASIGSDMLVAEHLQGTFKNIVEDDVRDDALKITQPTLLVYGMHDTATPPRHGKIFQEHIQDSKLEVIQDAGHFVYQDNPEETKKYIKEFLA